ncbi:MAG: CPBP family intramembrane metalloprotease [Anaerolineaceae bacterium]|nr:CPBP family intramembrane metalloprotease [Anaerolineaceae bacterium]
MRKISDAVIRYPLFSFFVLTFFLSWLAGFPAVIFHDWPGIIAFMMSFAPALAAVIILSISEKKSGVLALIESLRIWRVRWYWYVIILAGPAFTMLVTVLVFWGMGKLSVDESFPLFHLSGSHILVLVVVFLYQLVVVWGEELGWRGFALPRLQQRFHPIIAAVLLGLIWGIWHLPYFFMTDSVHANMSLTFFILSTVGYSIIYAWIYNGSKGSLLMMSLFHAANNTTVSFTMMFVPQIVDEPKITLMILMMFNGLIILFAGPKLLYKKDHLHC